MIHFVLRATNRVVY